MLHRFSIVGLILALLGCAALNTRAQGLRVAPSSTPIGDILRGEGAAAYGIGLGDYYDAAANAINADTFIKLNNYTSAVLRQENRDNQRAAQAERAKNRENWDKYHERIDNDPNAHDINNGDALNAKTKRLLKSGSSLRYSRTIVPADTIRRLSFALPRKGLTFSMQRMALKSTKQWPVTFQDPKFDRQRLAYVRAFGKALDQIEGKQTLAAIKDVEHALGALRAQLDRVVDPSKLNEEKTKKLYNEAKNHLRRLETLTDVLKDHQMQKVLVEIEQYSGTTVGDLLEFVNRNQLQFAVADPGDERTTIWKLHGLLQDELAALNPEQKNDTPR